MTTSRIESPSKAVAVRIKAHKFFVLLDDGREIGVPYSWFPRLTAATPAQREQWRLIGKGKGIHWEAVDEDLSVSALPQPAQGLKCICQKFRKKQKREALPPPSGVLTTEKNPYCELLQIVLRK